MTEQIKDGGPAFHDGHQYGYFTWRFGGVTVRDFFAAHAIAEAFRLETKYPTGPDGEASYKGIADRAFLIADAMLKAREVGHD